MSKLKKHNIDTAKPSSDMEAEAKFHPMMMGPGVCFHGQILAPET